MKKTKCKILGAVIILFVILSINIIAVAANTTEMQNSKDSNNKKINEAQSKLEDVQAEKSETVKQVEEISSQIDSCEAEIANLDNKIEEKNNLITESEAKLAQKEKDFTEQEKLLNSRLIASYEAGETSYWDVILSSRSISDLISNYFLITEVATYDAELLETIENEKKEIEKTKKELETAKQELDMAKSQKESASLQLKTKKQEKDTYVSKLSADEKKIQEEIDELKKANIQIDNEIEAAKARYAAQIAALSDDEGSTSGSSSSGFINPVNSYITTGIYYSNGSYHGGVDFGAAGINGAPIYAVADGVVIKTAALTTSYGNYIIIAHANGLYTLYAHGQAGSIAVSPGERVSQGQTIMRVGSTGNSTGPHLHFEVRVSPGEYANRVNPIGYLP